MEDPAPTGRKIFELPEYSTVSSKMKVFRYRPPETIKRRSFLPMVRSDVMIAQVQIIKEGGGEQELHSHGALDGFWFVLSGCAKFYGDGDVELATLAKHDGIYIPRNFLYWFEAVGDEPLELLQVEAKDKTAENTYYSPAPKPTNIADVYTTDGELIAGDLRIEQ